MKPIFNLSTSNQKLADQTPQPFDYGEEVLLFVQDMLNTILDLSNLTGTAAIVTATENRMVLDITHCEESGRVIGKDGQTLEALQILLHTMAFQKFGFRVFIELDIDQYIQRRRDSLLDYAEKMASKIINDYHDHIELRPMTPAQRRNVHLLFKDHDTISSCSEGEGENRRIVLSKRANTQDT